MKDNFRRVAISNKISQIIHPVQQCAGQIYNQFICCSTLNIMRICHFGLSPHHLICWWHVVCLVCHILHSALHNTLAASCCQSNRDTHSYIRKYVCFFTGNVPLFTKNYTHTQNTANNWIRKTELNAYFQKMLFLCCLTVSLSINIFTIWRIGLFVIRKCAICPSYRLFFLSPPKV